MVLVDNPVHELTTMEGKRMSRINITELAAGLASGQISITTNGPDITKKNDAPLTRAQAKKLTATQVDEVTAKVDYSKMNLRVIDVEFPDNPLGLDEGRMGKFVTHEETKMLLAAHETQTNQVIVQDGKPIYALIDPAKEKGKNILLYRSYQKIESVEQADNLEIKYFSK